MLPDRDGVFERIFIDHSTRGLTRVGWRVRPEACLPPGTAARLEIGYGANPGPDEWEDCGVSGVDCRLLSHEHLDPGGGLDNQAHYRVVLIPPGVAPSPASPPFGPPDAPFAGGGQGVVRSRAIPATGTLDRRAWLLARELLRREKNNFKVAHASRGWVLERREVGRVDGEGTVSPAVDPLTGVVLAPWRQASAGAEFVGGYRGPVPVRVLFDVSASEAKRDPERGLVNDDDQSRPARMICFPPVRTNDLVVIDGTDERYNVGRVETAALVGGVALVVTADLRKYPLGSPVYSVPVPEAWAETPPREVCP